MARELTQFEIRMNNMANQIENLAKQQADTNKKIDELHGDLKSFVKDAEKRFAGKWTERVLVFVGIGIGGALLTAVMSSILR